MISPLRYMGSKRSLAPTIADVIHARHPKATVVDVFAGTCAVGTAVAPRHLVHANDVHAFAAVIARTLLTAPATVPLPGRAWDELRPTFDKNMDALRDVLEPTISHESRLLARVKRPGCWRDFKEFADAALKKRVPLAIAGLRRIDEFRTQPRRTPFCLFSRYFSKDDLKGDRSGVPRGQAPC